MNLLFYVFVLLSIISEVLAQYLFKISHKTKLVNSYLVIGIILYAFTSRFKLGVITGRQK